MPCNCPEDPPRPNPATSCHYLAHAGSPATGLYRLVEQAIPDVELTHGRPTVHPDGSLEFPGPPPSIAGYRAEGQRLYPTWPPCLMRMLRVRIIDKMLTMTGLCGNREAGQFSQEATPDHCQNCPARQPHA